MIQPSNNSLDRLLGNRWPVTFVCALLWLAGLGCDLQPQRLSRHYGELSGTEKRNSVNGTRILADFFQAYGWTVENRSKITPRIDRYDAIVFFPQDRFTPSPAAIQRIETWLRDGQARTFIYIGRDYDAEIDYWQNMIETLDSSEQPHARRQLARALTRQDQARSANQPASTLSAPATPSQGSRNCDWFQQSRFPNALAEKLSGPIASRVTPERPFLPYSTLLSPITDDNTESLLKVDDKPFAFTIQQDDWNGGQIIVVSNAAFLLNYPLLDPENRILAGNLIQQLPNSGAALFLESPSNIQVREQDYENHNRWAWITKPPLKYIIPQFLFWGVIFCFVFFPIFGRPKGEARKSTTNFHQHILAMGRLLKRTRASTEVAQWISEYRDRSSNHQHRPSDAADNLASNHTTKSQKTDS